MKKLFFFLILSMVTLVCPADPKDDPAAPAATDVDAPVLAEDFILTDLEGEEFKLSSMRGKLIVLDFWGTWCGWCVKGFPKMKEFYEKHEGEFEVIGVDCGDKIEAWQRAVKLLKLPWKNVFQERDNKVSRAYSIKGFPTKIIINEEGYILYTTVGEDPRFYDKLEKFLKERRK